MVVQLVWSYGSPKYVSIRSSEVADRVLRYVTGIKRPYQTSRNLSRQSHVGEERLQDDPNVTETEERSLTSFILSGILSGLITFSPAKNNRKHFDRHTFTYTML